MPASRDQDKKELLADIVSFANTEGGVILYGVSTRRVERGADTGVADALPGVEIESLDATKQRIYSLLQDGVSPALSREVEMVAIPLADSKRVVLLVGVGKSLRRPHMVTVGGTN